MIDVLSRAIMNSSKASRRCREEFVVVVVVAVAAVGRGGDNKTNIHIHK